MAEEDTRQRIERYLARARRVLRTGHLVLEDGDCITAVNRAYYAIFYAANALLATKGLALCANMSETTLLRKLVYNIGAEEIRR